jgi:hypothetical protein
MNDLPTVEADPQKPYKAYMGGAVAAAMAFLAFWVGDDDPFTKKDAGEAALAALGAAIPGFGLTFWVRNPKMVERG